jgi:hypothetical protein
MDMMDERVFHRSMISKFRMTQDKCRFGVTSETMFKKSKEILIIMKTILLLNMNAIDHTKYKLLYIFIN